MTELSRRAFLASTTGLAGTLVGVRPAGPCRDAKESTSLQGAGRQRRAAAGRRAPAGKPAGHHAHRRGRPAGRRLEPRAGRRRLAVDAGALPGLRAAGPLHARLVGRRAQRRRDLRGQRRGGKVYTFKLRKGMKWSDGQPFTTEDIRFWYEDIFRDPEVAQADRPGLLVARRRERQARGHRRADLPVQLRRAERLLPPAARLGAAGPDGHGHPKHYLKQFHIKYNPDADALAKERGLRELDRAVPARERASPTTTSSSRTRSARRSTPGSSASRRARTPSARSPCAIPTTSRSTPRARSCPISTASSTRWSPIPRSCC